MIGSIKSRAVALGCMLVAAPLGVTAQSLDLLTGQQIRVEVDSVSLEGKLLRITPESLVLRRPTPWAVHPCDSLAIPRSWVSRAWVVASESRQTSKGALIGSGVGALLGGAVVAALYQPGSCDGLETIIQCFMFLGAESRGEAFAVGMVSGMFSGMLWGALIGHSSTRRTWREVTDPR